MVSNREIVQQAIADWLEEWSLEPAQQDGKVIQCEADLIDRMTAVLDAASPSVESALAQLKIVFPEYLCRQITTMSEDGDVTQIVLQKSIHSSRSRVWQGATLTEALAAAMGDTRDD